MRWMETSISSSVNCISSSNDTGYSLHFFFSFCCRWSRPNNITYQRVYTITTRLVELLCLEGPFAGIDWECSYTCKNHSISVVAKTKNDVVDDRIQQQQQHVFLIIYNNTVLASCSLTSFFVVVVYYFFLLLFVMLLCSPLLLLVVHLKFDACQQIAITSCLQG